METAVCLGYVLLGCQSKEFWCSERRPKIFVVNFDHNGSEAKVYTSFCASLELIEGILVLSLCQVRHEIERTAEILWLTLLKLRRLNFGLWCSRRAYFYQFKSRASSLEDPEVLLHFFTRDRPIGPVEAKRRCGGKCANILLEISRGPQCARITALLCHPRH